MVNFEDVAAALSQMSAETFGSPQITQTKVIIYHTKRQKFGIRFPAERSWKGNLGQSQLSSPLLHGGIRETGQILGSEEIELILEEADKPLWPPMEK